MVKINRILGVLAVAGVAFTAGTYWSGVSTATAYPLQDDDVPPEVQAQMAAWAKAAATGEHHEYLNELTGTWEGTFRMWMSADAQPMQSSGTVKREWVLGGRFIKETVHAQGAMGAFNGLGYIGFNNVDGRYEYVWMEDMSTSIAFGTGSYDPEAKVFQWNADYRDPATGRVIDCVNKLEISSPSHHTYLGYQIGANGKRFKSFEGDVHRQ